MKNEGGRYELTAPDFIEIVCKKVCINHLKE